MRVCRSSFQNNDVGVLDFDEVFLWIVQIMDHSWSHAYIPHRHKMSEVLTQPGDVNMNVHDLVTFGYNPSFE